MRADIADRNFTKVASGVNDDFKSFAENTAVPFLKEKAQDFRRNAEPIAEEIKKSATEKLKELHQRLKKE